MTERDHILSSTLNAHFPVSHFTRMMMACIVKKRNVSDSEMNGKKNLLDLCLKFSLNRRQNTYSLQHDAVISQIELVVQLLLL